MPSSLNSSTDLVFAHDNPDRYSTQKIIAADIMLGQEQPVKQIKKQRNVGRQFPCLDDNCSLTYSLPKVKENYQKAPTKTGGILFDSKRLLLEEMGPPGFEPGTNRL